MIPKKIYYINYIPYFRGIALAPFGVFIRKQYKGDKQLLVHELIHWKQYKRMGLFLYYFRYIFQLIFMGYDNMPMEIEARMYDKDWVKYNYRRYYLKKKKKNITSIKILKLRIEECDYHPDKTILRCNKCGKTKDEWYNDQPGDKHLGDKNFCGGIFIRVWKANYNIE